MVKYLLLIVGIVSVIIYYLTSKFIDKTKLNQNYKLFILSVLILNFLGELYFYYHLIYYDKVLHLLIPIGLTLGVKDYLKTRKINKTTTIFLSIFFLLIIFEVFEYYLDLFFSINMRGVFYENQIIMSPKLDTIIDLGLGSISSLFTSIFHRN